MDFSKFYNGLGDKFPNSTHKSLEVKLRYAGIEKSTALWLGSRFLLIFLFSFLGLLGYINFIDKNNYFAAISIFAILLMLFGALVYVNLFFAVMNRTTKVERSLPDFLMLIVSNLHAGMTPFAAFVQAARPEFGPLYYEVKEAAAHVGGKRSLDAALIDLSSRFDSEVFRKTVNLFLKGVKSGGQLAKLLSTNAEEIRRIQDLRAELISSTQTYSVFLAFIVVFVMPFLLAVGVNFLNTFITIQSQIGSPDTAVQSISIFSGKVGITAEEMKSISIFSLAVTGLFASFFMGIVRSGRALYGLKYYPILVSAAFISFLITENILAKLITLGQ